MMRLGLPSVRLYPDSSSTSLSAEFLYCLQKKADYIKRTTAILAEKYDGDIPNTFQGLVSCVVSEFGGTIMSSRCESLPIIAVWS